MIGWENNQGAYFIQKLMSSDESQKADISGLTAKLNNGESSITRISSVKSSAPLTLDVIKASGAIACFLVFVVGSDATRCRAQIVFVAGNGNITATELGAYDSETNAISFAYTANTIAITSTSSTASYVYVVAFTGKLQEHTES